MGLELYAGYTRCQHCGIFDSDPEWCDLCGRLTLDQGWKNSKDEADACQVQRGAEYVHALHQVWSVMHSLQGAERRQP